MDGLGVGGEGGAAVAVVATQPGRRVRERHAGTDAAGIGAPVDARLRLSDSRLWA